jgi:hypothetical protein
MKQNIKLQKRKVYGIGRIGRTHHCVYQIQIPIKFIKKLGWKKGDVLVLSSYNRPTITMKRKFG